MDTTTAPTLNKIALEPPAREPNVEQRERVAAAVHFGAALEELVARCRLQLDGPDAPRASGPRFPTDLSHRRDPEASLQVTLQKLLALEPKVIRGSQAETGVTTDGASDGSVLGTGEPPPDAPPAGIGVMTAASPKAALVRDGIGALLNGGLGDLTGLDDLIGEWDTYVVDSIAAFPEVLTGYKVGKALSLTRWRIWAAKYQTPVEGDWISEAWGRAFGSGRIREIQRQVNALSGVFDPLAVTVVATSLGYWRNALLTLPNITARPGPRPNPTTPTARPQTISIPDGAGHELEEALEKQLDNWLDLLTERRPPESFSVAGIVTSLTKDLTGELAAGWGARIARSIVPVFAVLAFLGIAATVVAALVLFLPQTQGGDVTGGQVGGLAATGLSGVFALLVARGRSLFDRGAGAVERLQGRMDALDNRLGEASDRTPAARQVSWQGLKDDVLSQLVGQIRLEELNIAVSEPLVGFVLALNDDESDDPKEDAQRFLRLAYGNRSNLDRLVPVFKEFYKNFRTPPPG